MAGDDPVEFFQNGAVQRFGMTPAEFSDSVCTGKIVWSVQVQQQDAANKTVLPIWIVQILAV